MLADRRMLVRRCLLAAGWTMVLTACGSDSDSSSPSPDPTAASESQTTTATASGPATSAGAAASSGGCPVSVDALSAATSLRWALRERRENQPLETNESIRATVCVFTASGAPQSGGDPLVFRTDVVTGGNAATVRREFRETCDSLSGLMRPAGGGSVCDRNGVVVEGIKGEGDRVVVVSFVNADTSAATSLTPAFSRLLEAVR